MSNVEEHERRVRELADAISEVAGARGHVVAAAESLTSGRITERLGATEASSDWFAGGVVAYQPHVKFNVLGVRPGPVVTEEAARAMATGVAELLDATAAVAVTGVGGPGSEEGQEAGTTWIAVSVHGDVRAERHVFSGEPLEVLAKTEERGLEMLLDAMRDAG